MLVKNCQKWQFLLTSKLPKMANEHSSCFMLLLEFITRSHASKCVRQKGEGKGGEWRGWGGRKGEREVEGEQFNRIILS